MTVTGSGRDANNQYGKNTQAWPTQVVSLQVITLISSLTRPSTNEQLSGDDTSQAGCLEFTAEKARYDAGTIRTKVVKVFDKRKQQQTRRDDSRNQTLTKVVFDSRGRNELLYSESSDSIFVCDFACQLVPHWCVRQYKRGKKWSPVEPEATKCHRRRSPIEPCCHGHVLPLWHDLSFLLPARLSASHSLSVYVCFAMYRLMYICPCICSSLSLYLHC